MVQLIDEVHLPTARVNRLRKLSDVDVGRPSGGEVLTYDGVTGRWRAKPQEELVTTPAEHDHDERYILKEDASQFAPANHSHPVATTSSAGFMSAADKAKLDGISGISYITRQGSGSSIKLPSNQLVTVTNTEVTLSPGTYLIIAQFSYESTDPIDTSGYPTMVYGYVWNTSVPEATLAVVAGRSSQKSITAGVFATSSSRTIYLGAFHGSPSVNISVVPSLCVLHAIKLA